MTEQSETIEVRRRRLRFRGWHRGTKENDLLIGRFIDQKLEELDNDHLDQLEDLLNHVADADFYNWVTKKVEVPAQYDTAILQMIRDVNNIE